MNLNQLFPLQQKLDDYIKKEKELEGVDLLPRKTVALICELYECINEARFFKFWSDNTSPVTKEVCYWCEGKGELLVRFYEEGKVKDVVNRKCDTCSGFGYHNPLLEEYVDVIHFTLSLANDFEIHEYNYIKEEPKDLNRLTLGITNLATIIPHSRDKSHIKSLINNVITLGYQLGFHEKMVIDAYYEKNKENFRRQEEGY